MAYVSTKQSESLGRGAHTYRHATKSFATSSKNRAKARRRNRLAKASRRKNRRK